jgi:hypothetical protein
LQWARAVEDLRRAHEAFHNDVLRNELKGIVDAQKDWLARNAKTELELAAGRAIIVAVWELEDRLERLAVRFDDQQKKDIGFDD